MDLRNKNFFKSGILVGLGIGFLVSAFTLFCAKDSIYADLKTRNVATGTIEDYMLRNFPYTCTFLDILPWLIIIGIACIGCGFVLKLLKVW